jgi:hypothetical protein
MNLNTNHYDHRNLEPRKKNRANTSEPAHTRAGQTYPGGKHMRRALAKLEIRNRGRKEGDMGARRAGSMQG